MHSAKIRRVKHRAACRRFLSYNINKSSRGIRKRRINGERNSLRSITKSAVGALKLEANCQDQESSSMASSTISTDLHDNEEKPHHFTHLLGSLRSMKPDAQLQLWKTMIENHPFDYQQLTALRTAIEKRIKLDIVSGAPYEIARYIMSFLSPKDLCQAAQVCKSWRTVCEDNRLWREKCEEEGLLDDELTLGALLKNKIINSHKKHEKFLTENLTSACVDKYEWKAAYMKHMDILRNWRTRNFEISEPFIAPSPMQIEQLQNPPTGSSENSNNPGTANRSDQSSVGPLRNTTRRAGNTPTENSALRPRRSLRHRVAEFAGDNLNILSTNASEPYINGSREKNDLADKDFSRANRYLMQLRCHEDSVITCLQYNPRTNTIVSGSDDHTLKVWNSETGRCIVTLEGHTGGVWSSQLSPDDIVISGATDRTLRVWKAHTGELIHTMVGHTSTVRCLALDGNRVVSGSRDMTLRLWDITEGVCIQMFHGHSAAVRCVEFKNNIIVSGAYDHLVMVWDATTGICRHILECHISRIYSLQFDGKTIASGSLDSTICIWDATNGKLRHRLKGHNSLTSKMQLKGNLLVSANADSFCKVWNIKTGECMQTLGGDNKHTSAITSVYFNNRHVVTSSDDGTVKLWDIRNGKFIKDLIVLPTASKGGVVWRIRASYTKLICAVGSRTQTEDTHLLVLDFNA